MLKFRNETLKNHGCGPYYALAIYYKNKGLRISMGGYGWIRLSEGGGGTRGWYIKRYAKIATHFHFGFCCFSIIHTKY